MNSDLKLVLWNVKGIRTKEKQVKLWQTMKRMKNINCWCFQEHHLDRTSPRKQVLGDLIFFYCDSVEGDSGVMMAVNRDLEPKIVFKHQLGTPVRESTWTLIENQQQPLNSSQCICPK